MTESLARFAQAECPGEDQRHAEKLNDFFQKRVGDFEHKAHENEADRNERQGFFEVELREARVNLFELRTNSISVAHGVFRLNRRVLFVHALREVAFVDAH